MAETMTPSESMTSGQIGKIQELLGAGLRKADLPGDATQEVLENQGHQLVGELVAVVRKFVEAVCSLICRIVTVNRVQEPRQALEATGRVLYVDDDVVKTMPRGKGEKAKVFFFKVGRYVSDDQLEEECASRGLVPTDPYSLAKVNEDDPAFADSHPNGTHWKDSSGKWCYAAFRQWHDGKRSVYVDRRGSGWDGYWWFAGSRE